MACGPFEIGCVVVLGGREDVSSACGLARSPSGHFASVEAAGSDEGTFVAAGNGDHHVPLMTIQGRRC